MRVQVEKMAGSLMPLLDGAPPLIERPNLREEPGQIATAEATP
jgi:hypothetical protein